MCVCVRVSAKHGGGGGVDLQDGLFVNSSVLVVFFKYFYSSFSHLIF